MAKGKYEKPSRTLTLELSANVDHGKTTLTPRICHGTKCKRSCGCKTYAEMASGTVRDDSKIVTIAVSPCRI